jgi:L1 cell adhesion molecule like protein
MGFAMRSHQVTQAAPAAVGIDLGTTFSRVALWRDGDVLIIPNDRGKLATPSCVAFTDQHVLIGEAAQEQADVNLDNTIFAPQRLIGFKFENPWVQWYMKSWPSKVVRGDDDKPMIKVRDRGKERLLRPEDIVTMLLVHLRKMAERYLSVSVMDAVVTVPACYGKKQREAILDACQGARLNVLDLIKSPTAAAVAYSLTNPSRGKRNVLVCDMGGSYFDFSLLTLEEGALYERAIGTDYVDLDNCIVRFCQQDLRDKFSTNIAGQQLALERLRRGCEVAKRRLSQYNQARIEVTAIVDGVDYVCNISRGHFEELCKDDIEPLLEPINWCLEDSAIDKPDVHEVVLVGGSARIPRIRRAIREFFYGKVPREVLRPDHAAVLGAAAYVALLGGLRTGDMPSELKHIRVYQVTPWSMMQEPGDDNEEEPPQSDKADSENVHLQRSPTFDEPMDLIPSDGIVNSPNRTKTSHSLAEEK